MPLTYPAFAIPNHLKPPLLSRPPLPSSHPPRCSASPPTPDSRYLDSFTSPPPTATPLLDALLLESRRIRANFFCPGHKQGASSLLAFRAALGHSALALDLPELPTLDNLFAPEGVIEESQQLAAGVFTPDGPDAWETFFLVNGSTGGVEAAVLAAVRPGRKVVLPRNSHQSAVHALVLSGAVPVWVEPVYDARKDLLHGVRVEDVARALAQHEGEVDAVLIISPTYHGVCSDVRAVAEVVHEAGALLLVDEAHGAHFAFHDSLPEPATYCNADVVVQSTHKTLSALSQAAMMHVRKSAIDKQKVASALQLVQSTSPNYLLLASLEAVSALMNERGESIMSQTIDLAQNCAIRIDSLDGFSVFGMQNDTSETPDRHDIPFVHALDPTRITVLLPNAVTGYDMDTHLIDRFGVYAELPSFKHITFVITPGNTQQDIDCLVTSLALFEATRPEDIPYEQLSDEMPGSGRTFGETTTMTPRAAFFAMSEKVDADEAVGRISVETLCPYPPGIPVIVPGERVTKECVSVLKAVLDAGGSVSGASDESLSTIRVVRGEEEERINQR